MTDPSYQKLAGHRDLKHDWNRPTWFYLYLQSLQRQQECTNQAQILRQELIATKQQKLDQFSQRERDVTMSGKHTMGKALMPRILREQFEAAMHSMRLTSRLKSSDKSTKTSDKSKTEQKHRRRIPTKSLAGKQEPQSMMALPLEYPKFPFELNENIIMPSVTSPPGLKKRQSFSPAYKTPKNQGFHSLPEIQSAFQERGMVRYRTPKDGSNKLSHSFPQDLHTAFQDPEGEIYDDDNFMNLYSHLDVVEIPYGTDSRSNNDIKPHLRLPAIHSSVKRASAVDMQPKYKEFIGGQRNGMQVERSVQDFDEDISEPGIMHHKTELSGRSAKHKCKTVRFAEELAIDIPDKVFIKRISKNESQDRERKQTLKPTIEDREQMISESLPKDHKPLDDNAGEDVDAEFEELGKKYAEKMKRRASYKSKHRRSVQLTAPPCIPKLNLPLAVAAIVEHNAGSKDGTEQILSNLNTKESNASECSLPPLLDNSRLHNGGDMSDMTDKEGSEVEGLSKSETHEQIDSTTADAALRAPLFPPIVARNKHYKTFTRMDEDYH